MVKIHICLSNTNFCGHSYLNIHVLLNNCLTLTDALSMYSSLPAGNSLRLNFGT